MSHTKIPLQTENLVRANDVVARYIVRSNDLEKAANAIAIGQSIGNPNVRLNMETAEMWDRFGCNILDIKPVNAKEGEITIGYPVGNLTTRSLTHLLAMVMGGQMDIDLIESCRLIDLTMPAEFVQSFKGPNKGIEGIRNFLEAHNRPLIGGIVKPKTGVTPDQIAEICHQMADGGVDFIKEDEILGDISYCPFDVRVEKISRALEGYKVIYAPCVTSPIDKFPQVVERVKTLSPPTFHFNVWGGLDAFQYLAGLVGGFSFYQKSGDKVITEGRFSIDFTVWCKLARLAGADFIHAGMVGGYLDEPISVMKERLYALAMPWHGLKSTIGSLSCGATPGMVEGLGEALGTDIMISSGGCLHAHPLGTRAGAKAFRDAAEGKSSKELDIAIKKFGVWRPEEHKTKIAANS